MIEDDGLVDWWGADHPPASPSLPLLKKCIQSVSPAKPREAREGAPDHPSSQNNNRSDLLLYLTYFSVSFSLCLYLCEWFALA